MTDTQKKIFKAVARSEGPCSLTYLAKKFGRQPAVVRKGAIRGLIRQGFISKAKLLNDVRGANPTILKLTDKGRERVIQYDATGWHLAS